VPQIEKQANLLLYLGLISKSWIAPTKSELSKVLKNNNFRHFLNTAFDA
jgi:hypothetical protein